MIREGEIEVHTNLLQTILAAATLPSSGEKSIEKYIEKRYPNAVKVSNSHMHKHHPRIRQEFIKYPENEASIEKKITIPERVDMIVAAILSSSDKISASSLEQGNEQLAKDYKFVAESVVLRKEMEGADLQSVASVENLRYDTTRDTQKSRLTSTFSKESVASESEVTHGNNKKSIDNSAVVQVSVDASGEGSLDPLEQFLLEVDDEDSNDTITEQTEALMQSDRTRINRKDMNYIEDKVHIPRGNSLFRDNPKRIGASTTNARSSKFWSIEDEDEEVEPSKVSIVGVDMGAGDSVSTVSRLETEKITESVDEDSDFKDKPSTLANVVAAFEEKELKDGTMVFVNTAEVAMSLANALRQQNVSCAEYHKLLSMEEKEEELGSFRRGDVNVMVCTDHAARGLDLPGVNHVVQAEFALNVVNHMHRIGRGSRGGKLGRATNFYDHSSAVLVESILSDYNERGVDQSFSRKRGLRQRLKKEERRGQETPENNRD